MKVITEIKAATFPSREGSSCSASLTVTATPGTVMMVLGNEFKETYAVEMSSAEANDIATDLAKLLTPHGSIIRREDRAEGGTIRKVEGTDLDVHTRIAVAGDPYREDISLEIRDSSYDEKLFIELDCFICQRLIGFLKQAGELS